LTEAGQILTIGRSIGPKALEMKKLKLGEPEGLVKLPVGLEEAESLVFAA
jgi:hypothetical protein